MSAHPLNTFDSLHASQTRSGRSKRFQIQNGIAIPNDNDSNLSSILTSATSLSLEHRLSDPEHLRKMTQIAYKQTRCTNVDWQDALQTAQLKLLKGLRAGKFTGNEANFDRWALTVAKFAIIDLIRASVRHNTQSIDRLSAANLAIIDTLANINDELANIESADLVWQVREKVLYLDRLYPQRSYYRLWLGKVNEATQSEIAQQLGVTQGTISKRWKDLVAYLSLELADLLPDNFTNALLNTRI